MLNTEPTDKPRPPPGAEVIDIDSARNKLENGAAEAAQLAAIATDVAIGDWHTLLSAVRLKLRLSAEQQPHRESNAQDALDHIQDDVLHCAQALDQLHATMLHHIERSQALEGAFAAAQATLARVRVELASSHADERAARHLASHDQLTSLPNGAGFRARLAAVTQAANRGQAFAVLYIDLDGFKAINDTHGHAVGDHLLRIVGARLTGEMRSGDMVSRLGGDEFACLLWLGSPGVEALTRVARSIFESVSQPLQVGALSLTVRPSIGIALWPDDGATAELLLEHADAAMYRAKRQRSGHAYFDARQN